jgi:hypothetical protein
LSVLPLSSFIRSNQYVLMDILHFEL